MFQFISSRGEARGVFRVQSSVCHGAHCESSSGYAGFFVHPGYDGVPGFASPNKLLQRVNKCLFLKKAGLQES